MKALIRISVLALVAWGCGCQAASAGTLEVIRSIDFPRAHSYGGDLAWDGQYLWSFAVLGGPSTVFGMDPRDGSVVSSFEHGFPNGDMVWDGVSLWVSFRETALVGNDAPSYIKKLASDGTVIATVEPGDSPTAAHGGAAWDGSSFWFSDARWNKLIQTSPSDGSVIKSISSPVIEPSGLEWAWGSLWVISRSDKQIWQLDADGHVLEEWATPLANPRGIAFDGEHLWVLDSTFENAKIIELAVPEPWSLSILLGAALCFFGVLLRARRA